MSASANLPFSSAAGEAHGRSLATPEQMLKALKHRMNPAAQASVRHNCLTSSIVKCARQGVAASGFRDTFEQFHDKESRVDGVADQELA